jgi:hypothetical protein
MYGRADGMPSFQLTMAVRTEIRDLLVYISMKKELHRSRSILPNKYQQITPWQT